MTAQPLFFLVAGEPSGDVLGARLMAALKRETGGAARFAGVGGPLMRAEGLDSLIDIRELSLIGLAEVVRHIPRVLRLVRQVADAARAEPPDLFCSIDAPAFTLRVAKDLQSAGFPLVHYVAPSVWAWKPWRAKRIAGYLDHLLTLLPFEPPYFTKHGLDATFVGHPAVEAALDPPDPEGLRQRLGIAPEQPLVAVLPGSRRSEVERLSTILGETLGLLKERLPGFAAVVPSVPNVLDLVKARVAEWPVAAHVVLGEAERRNAFAASRVAIAKSGTVGLELAIAGLPAVMVYKVAALSAAIARRMIKVQWASIASLVLNRLVQPERLQEHCTPQEIMEALAPLLEEGAERRRVIDEGYQAARLLGLGRFRPSEKAAKTLLSLLPAGRFPGQEPSPAS